MHIWKRPRFISIVKGPGGANWMAAWARDYELETQTVRELTICDHRSPISSCTLDLFLLVFILCPWHRGNSAFKNISRPFLLLYKKNMLSVTGVLNQRLSFQLWSDFFLTIYWTKSPNLEWWFQRFKPFVARYNWIEISICFSILAFSLLCNEWNVAFSLARPISRRRPSSRTAVCHSVAWSGSDPVTAGGYISPTRGRFSMKNQRRD